MRYQIDFPSTVVWRHRKENLKKCSLRGLEVREDFSFFIYPGELPDLTGYILLDFEGEPLSEDDADRGLLIIDGTWRYAALMLKQVETQCQLVRRSIPPHFRTAYPRRQADCPDPDRGLASLEAIFIAYHLLGRDVSGLLDDYYWKQQFLSANGLS